LRNCLLATSGGLVEKKSIIFNEDEMNKYVPMLRVEY